MKIGVVVDNEFFSDVRVLSEVEILKNAGHDVFVLHLSYTDSKIKNIIGVETKAILFKRKKKDFIYATMNWNPAYENIWIDNISKLIDDNDLDALHVHDLYMAKSGRKGIDKSSKKIDLTLDLHENYPYAIQLYEWATKFPRNLLVQPNKWLKKEKEYLLYADKIVVLSDFFADSLSEKYSIEKSRFFVYPNVPNVAFFDDLDLKEKVLEKGNKITLFYFGVVARRRGIYTLLDGYEKLKKEFKNIELLIIGPVDKNDKVKLSSRIGKLQDVVYYPWKEISEFPLYVSYADICVSPLEKNPQHESGVANKVYQYMLFAKPLLVSNCGPQAELVESTNSGLVFTHDSVEDFVEKTRQLISDKNNRQQLGENGRVAILEKYNMENFSKKFLEMYSS